MNIKNIIKLQLVVMIYTLSSIMSKIAAGYTQEPVKLVVFFGLEFVFLGIYAILWQQMIKKFDLSVAYANRSMHIIWSMICAAVFFHNDISVKNLIGVVLILTGTIIVNMENTEADATKDNGGVNND